MPPRTPEGVSRVGFVSEAAPSSIPSMYSSFLLTFPWGPRAAPGATEEVSTVAAGEVGLVSGTALSSISSRTGIFSSLSMSSDGLDGVEVDAAVLGPRVVAGPADG